MGLFDIFNKIKRPPVPIRDVTAPKEELKCGNCGNKIEEHEKFCTHCGNCLCDEPPQPKPNPNPVIDPKIQKEIDALVFQSYKDSIRYDLDLINSGLPSYIDYFKKMMKNSSTESKFLKDLTDEDLEKSAISSYERLKQGYSDYVSACPISLKEEDEYIETRARMEMKRFGACHRIWNLKKAFLKEKYGIDWKTPDELHPDIYFD